MSNEFGSAMKDALNKSGITLTDSKYTRTEIEAALKFFCKLNKVECPKCREYFPNIGNYCQGTEMKPSAGLYDSKYKEGAIAEFEKLGILPLDDALTKYFIFPEVFFYELLKDKRFSDMNSHACELAISSRGKVFSPKPK